MIALLTGKLKRKTVDSLIVDVGGVGYLVYVPLTTYTELPEPEAEVTLHIHTHVREDALTLFGFLSEGEKNLFLVLIGVSGIGPKLALTILSSMPFSDFIQAVSSSDHAKLCSIPGIGKKTAGHIVLELKDKMKAFPARAIEQNAAGETVSHVDDAISALVNLGYKKTIAEDALKKISQSRPADSLQELIRKALGALQQRS